MSVLLTAAQHDHIQAAIDANLVGETVEARGRILDFLKNLIANMDPAKAIALLRMLETFLPAWAPVIEIIISILETQIEPEPGPVA